MTVKQLIERLEQLDPDAKVMIHYDYGDRHRTTVAGEIEAADDALVTWSAYHNMHKIVEDDDDDGREVEEVVILGEEIW